jgi:hypothetical protein
VYGWGAAPSVLFGDSAELQAVALCGGVAHPTGYPAFALAGQVFRHLPLPDPAFRINLMSAFFGAVAVALLVALAAELGLSPPFGLAAAIVFGATYSFWAAALRAEVYTLSMCQYLLALWSFFVARRSGRFGHVLLSGLLLGLCLTGHLTTALPVALLGLLLAGEVLQRRTRVPLRLVLLASAFLVGLTPYLYVVWEDVHRAPMDYLRLVDLANWPLGSPGPQFDTPWKRLLWLIVGRDQMPALGIGFHPRTIASAVYNAGAPTVLFDLGPIASLLVLVGLARLGKLRPRDATLVAALVALTVLFAAAVDAQALFCIFLIPAYLLCGLLAGFALEALLERPLARWSAATAAIVPALVAVAIMAAPHTLRLYADSHPIPPMGWRMVDEDRQSPSALIRRLDRPYEARDYGEGLERAIPPHALVVGLWRHLTVLRYCQNVLGRRPDLSLQPFRYPGMLPRLEDWQRRYSLADRPIVFLSFIPQMASDLARCDSVSIPGHGSIYVEREPLHGLPGR